MNSLKKMPMFSMRSINKISNLENVLSTRVIEEIENSEEENDYDEHIKFSVYHNNDDAS